MDSTEIVDFLKKSPLFESLSKKQLLKIAIKVKVRQFFPDEKIVFQGEPSNSLFMITNGIVAVKNTRGDQESLLAYLMPGNTFGEMGIIENQARSATVVALSEVDTLVIQRNDFLYILNRYPSVAIELARTLGKYLVQANRRLSKDEKNIRIILIFNLHEDTGGEGLAGLIAQELTTAAQRPTAVVEIRKNVAVLQQLRSFARGGTYHHPGGYDILLPKEEGSLPDVTRMALMLDRLKNAYENIIFSLPGELNPPEELLLQDADQVLLITPPFENARQKLEDLHNKIRKRIRPGETSLFTLLNRPGEKYKGKYLNPKDPQVDFQIPYLEDFPDIMPKKHERMLSVPKAVAEVVDTCIDRLERTHSIGVFIPSTVEVDQVIDPETYIQETLNFMAARFGGATSREAEGVWNSEDSGLVGETVHIIESYMSQSDMNTHLDEVVSFVKKLKLELRQEAMALEVDRKLTLI